jgi:hypothetical protein
LLAIDRVFLMFISYLLFSTFSSESTSMDMFW